MEMIDDLDVDYLTTSPAWVVRLMNGVRESSFEEALAKIGRWRRQVTKNSQDQVGLDRLKLASERLRQTDASPVAALFLLYVGFPLLKDHFGFINHLYFLGRQAFRALDGIPGEPAVSVRKHIIRLVTRTLLAPENEVAMQMVLFGHETEWSFDGSAFTIDQLVKVRLSEVLRTPDGNTVDHLRLMCGWARGEADGKNLAHAIRSVVSRRWSEFGPQLLEIWLKYGFSDWTHDRGNLVQMLDFFPLARSDRHWFMSAVQRLLESLTQGPRVPLTKENVDAWCRALLSFTVEGTDGGRGLTSLLAAVGPDQMKPDLFETLLEHAWNAVAPTDLAQLLNLLWQEERFRKRLMASSFASSESRRANLSLRVQRLPKSMEAAWLVARLGELPVDGGRHHGGRPELGPVELAAWRSEVVERLRSDKALRRAAPEFLLWNAEGLAADEVELTLLALYATPEDRDCLRPLMNHLDRRVQLRARALLHVLEGVAGIAQEAAEEAGVRSLSQTVTDVGSAVESRASAQTWINDRRVEELIFGAISRVERRFCSEYPREWEHDEERLVSRLLIYMEEEFREAERILRDLVMHGLGAPIQISLTYRETTKREEGDRISPTSAHDTDVAFIFHAEEGLMVTAERACLMQFKKLRRASAHGDWEPVIDVDPVQRDELIRLTDSAFYLFMVPAFDRAECWVLPARLVRSIMRADVRRRKRILLRAAAHRAHRSLAEWLTNDVIGLWTGDEDGGVLTRAKGNHSGRVPRFIVEVTVRRGHEVSGQ